MPDWKARIRGRLTALKLDPATESDIIEELAQHLEDRYRDLLAQRIDEDEAVAQAWREIEGHPKLAAEIARARMRLRAMPVQDTSRNGWGALVDDLRVAWCRLRHAPGFALVALLTVTLTVGANTAILSVADAVLFRPLPYADSDNVAIIQMLNRKSGQQFTMTPYALVHAIDAGCPSISAVGLLEAFEGRVRPTMETADGPASVPTAAATANYFEILGVRPAHGRLFNAGDAGREGTIAVLSFAAWQQMFGADAGIVGRPVTFGSATFDVVGILPSGFVFPAPFVGRPSIVVLRRPLNGSDSGGTFHAIVRITSGMARERAQSEVEAAAAGVSAKAEEADSVPYLNDVRTMLYPVGRPIMRFLLAAAVFILFLGCANLANVLLVRGRRGLHETAIRLALGASRMRVIRPIVFEAVILGIGGALLALGTTALTFDALLRHVPPAAYGSADIGVDYRVALLALTMGLVCAVAFSIVPAWRASGVDALALIRRRGGGGSRVRLGRPLVAMQVAIAVAVVFGAIVAGRAFVAVLQIPVGFSAEHVIRVGLAFPAETTPEARRAAYDRVIQTLGTRSDLEVVSAAGLIPFSGRAPDSGIRAVPEGPLIVGLVYAFPGYFEALNLQLIRGRSWRPDELRTEPASAILSVSAVRVLFGERDPLGATFDNGRGQHYRVVGIVADVRNRIDRDTAPLGYVFPPPGRGVLQIVAKARERRPSVLAAVRADARSAFPSGLTTVEWYEDAIAANTSYQNPRFQTLVLSGLATLALGLTTIGIFSVVAYLVAARRRELGVRLAIGARPASIVGLVIRQSLSPVAAGLAGGLLLIYLGRSLAEAQLFKVDTADPAALAASAVTVFVSALLAAFLPARRATRINPTDVLRAD